ncbi:MAG: AAA family ATPase [bacterium]|nr:AAA family ATPase [bacterium]
MQNLNSQMGKALLLLTKTEKHVFISGQAGTGKSTLLDYSLTLLQDKNVVVVAPTGVAALNVNGETIHHFLRLKPGASQQEVIEEAQLAKKTKLAKLYQSLEILIVDEISMVRADLFDQMDLYLRTIRRNRLPFGGVRMVLFGDLYQLPPVIKHEEEAAFRQVYETPYFFSSHVFQHWREKEHFCNFAYVELEKIYRQTDEKFIDFLTQIRHNTLTEDDLVRINDRVLEISSLDDIEPSYVILTTTKAQAQKINLERLSHLSGKAIRFIAQSSGRFNETNFPTDENLILKVGARVMFLNNDSDGRWVNGSTGEVTSIDTKNKMVFVQLDDGVEVTVASHTWETSESNFDLLAGKIKRQITGSFIQLPLKLAWAITIHKAQGKTFPKLVIDLERGAFAAGQTYVAFSRGTCLSGLNLLRPLQLTDVQLDPQMLAFLQQLPADLAAGREQKAIPRLIDDEEQNTLF